MYHRFCLFLNGSLQNSVFKICIAKKNISPALQNDSTINEKIIYYAADGGLKHIIARQFPLDNLYWVGDGDSINKKTRVFLQTLPKKNLTKLAKNKDFSDLAAIFNILAKFSYQEPIFIEIYAGLGKRADHQYANIQEAKKFLANLGCGGVIFFHGGIVLTNIKIDFLMIDNKKFSIFVDEFYHTNKVIKITGAKYCGEVILQQPSHGLSNIITNKNLSIDPNGNLLTIYFVK